MSAQRTYWHLEPLKRIPSDYDIVTSNLLYYVGRGFEVETPLSSWYDRYQAGSLLRSKAWEHYRDPRETTYSKYTELQRKRETFVDGLLDSIDTSGYDRRLSPEWLSVLERVLGPLRYPGHGLQMVAAYVGCMAPAGRLVITGAFQAADEMRRVQRLAYRLRHIRESYPSFGETSEKAWQQDAMWQPLRRVLERLLVTFDFGEALVALNVVVKPAFDELFMVELGKLAALGGDEVLQQLFLSLNEDCAWHRDWTRALLRTILDGDPDMRDVVHEWVLRWRPQMQDAIAAFSPLFEVLPVSGAGRTYAEVASSVETRVLRYSSSILNPETTPEGLP
jgi:toluene monooxygenase system protein E